MPPPNAEAQPSALQPGYVRGTARARQGEHQESVLHNRSKPLCSVLYRITHFASISTVCIRQYDEVDGKEINCWRLTLTVKPRAPAAFFAFLRTPVPRVFDLAITSSSRRRTHNEVEELELEAGVEAE